MGRSAAVRQGQAAVIGKHIALMYEMAQWPLIPTQGRQRQSDLRSA